MKFTQGPAKSEPRNGGEFEMFNGMISGTYVNLEENRSIVMKWKMRDWDSTSDVTITLNPLDDDVIILLLILNFVILTSNFWF